MHCVDISALEHSYILQLFYFSCLGDGYFESIDGLKFENH